jgi:hypothetical protein
MAAGWPPDQQGSIAKRMCNWMPRDRVRALLETPAGAPITARNSTPAAAMLWALELAINVDNRPRFAPSNKHTIAVAASQADAAAEPPQHAQIGGEHTLAFRLSSTSPASLGQSGRSPHDGRSASFCCWHDAPRRCSRCGLLPLGATANLADVRRRFS